MVSPERLILNKKNRFDKNNVKKSGEIKRKINANGLKRVDFLLFINI